MRRIIFIISALLCVAMAIEAKPRKLSDDLKWDVTPDGTLVISGYGAMPDWPTPQSQAWYKEKLWHKIRKVKIEEGVTSIGFKNFSPTGEEYKRSSPIEISLPSSLQKIGDFAFKATPVANLLLPAGLKQIGLGSFSGALHQPSLDLPTTLVAINDGAFMRCDIDTVNFNSDVVVSSGAFFECKPLKRVNFNYTWSELAQGAFEGNHQLVELLALDNVRIPGGNPFVRTPMERTPLVMAAMGIRQERQPKDESLASSEEEDENVAKNYRRVAELDVKIPEMDGIGREHTFALVIGNENYRRESEVPFASNDAKIFARYLQKTLGIPQKNIHLIEDASLNDIKYGLNLLAKTCSAFDGDANIIVYYAGHGVPDESTKDAFLLPVDGYGADTSTGYSLRTLYDRLANMPTQSAVLFLDACFSGTKREGEMLASARGVALVPKKEEARGNLVVFSAAQDDETAFAYNEEGHGMFTYFLLKKLQQNMGDVTLGELSDYIISNVKQSSITENHKSQTPNVSAPAAAGETWRDRKL